MQRLLVNQADITQVAIEDTRSVGLEAGQARLTLRRFALTANNVTYAACGFTIGYWNFFPSGIDGQGVLPVWGFAEVVESQSDALKVGARLYGFLPLAEELVIEPEVQGASVILDASKHRADLPVVYNRYTLVKPRPAAEENLQALLQPLLATSYLLSDWLLDNAFFGAQQVIVGSASSKTGLGLCKFLAEQSPRSVKVVGLTSRRNMPFVQSLGACDTVVGYDDIESIDAIPSVYVDMAGSVAVKARLHTHLAKVLTHSCAVGMSHWDEFKSGQKFAGPTPEFFFAPAQIEKRRADWGPGVIDARIGEAWRRIASDASTWLDVKPHAGMRAVPDIYTRLADGTASPRDGFVVSL
ncbi:MAG: DUF2855 family protein [Paracoccaceae bacterium]